MTAPPSPIEAVPTDTLLAIFRQPLPTWLETHQAHRRLREYYTWTAVVRAEPVPEPAPASVRPASPKASTESISSVRRPVLPPECIDRIVVVMKRKQDSTASTVKEKLGSLLGGLVKPDAQSITKRWLRDHDLTLRDLVADAEIPITDLKKAGIVQTFEDMLDLGFRTEDLTANTRCFSVGHLVTLFRVGYPELKANRTCGGFTLDHLREADPAFTGNDLATLRVNLPELLGLDAPDVNEKPPSLRLLALTSLSPAEAAEVGLTREHLDLMGMNPEAARRHVPRWSPKEIAQVFGYEDPAWQQAPPSQTGRRRF